MSTADDPDEAGSAEEVPLRRRNVIALVGLISLLPIAAAIAVFVVWSRSSSGPQLPALRVGSCVDVTGPQHDVSDTTCPGGNGRVIAVVSSTTQCPSSARWGIIRDYQIYCVVQTTPDDTTG